MDVQEEVAETKGCFLRKKMINLLRFLYERLEQPLRSVYPNSDHLVHMDSIETVVGKMEVFASTEEKEKFEADLFDKTKHICLMVLGGVPMDFATTSQKMQNINILQRIVVMMLHQGLVTHFVKQALQKEQEPEFIMPVPGEVIEKYLQNPKLQQELLGDQVLELAATSKILATQVNRVMQEEDWIKVMRYLNCFIDVVTNL